MERNVTAILASLILAFSLSVVTSDGLAAQEYENTPVSISKDKIKIADGTICYSHIVLEKQTLYSISKAYNVSIEDIYRYNPGVKEEGLKKNAIIIIPVVDVPETGTEEKMAPSEKVGEKVAETIHVVKWFEDLEMIARKYGVTSEAIMKANGLKDRKLSKRMKLIIPSSSDIEETVEEDVVTEPQDSTENADTVKVNENALFPGWMNQNKDVNISVLLPLKADGSNSSRNNMDFYSGVLLAAHDLGKEGINLELSVFDVADGNLPVTESRIEASDFVIGPVSSGDLKRLFELAPGKSHVISPLDPRAEQLVYAHENMIHAPTPHAVQYNDLASWIKEDTQPKDRVLVITEKGAGETANVSMMKAAIDSAGITYNPFSYSILEGRNVTDPLAYLMTENGVNRVFIASESEAFVNDVVRNLNVMIHKKYDVVLYSPSKIRSFETIEVENFHNTFLHVSLGYYIDYDDPRVMDFLLKYRALFNTEPSQFAFQGYDLTCYFARLSSKYGNRWPAALEQSDTRMLQNIFSFKKSEDGGYVNNGVRRIIYGDDWSVTELK